MRLVDLDDLNVPGKTMIMKVLDKYEKNHPLHIIAFPIHEYDVILHPNKDYFEVKKR